MPPDKDTPYAAGLDSRSLLPLLRGDLSSRNGWDNEAVSQCRGTDLMIKRDALKYTSYEREGVGETLFDLDVDPRERVNAIDDPAYARPWSGSDGVATRWGLVPLVAREAISTRGTPPTS